MDAEETAHVEPSERVAPEMVAPKDVHSPQQTVALSSTRLFESVEYDEQDARQEHGEEYDAGVATSAFDDRNPEVQRTSGFQDSAAARECESENSETRALSWSSPADGMPHDDRGYGGDAQDQSPPYPCEALACTASPTEDIPAAFDGLSVQAKKACQFKKRINTSSVGLTVGSLSDTNKGRGQQRGGAVGIAQPPPSALFWQGDESGGGERLSTMEKPVSQLQRGLGNRIVAIPTQSPQSLGCCGIGVVEKSTVSEGTVPTLGSIASLHGGPCATSQVSAVGSIGLEEGPKRNRNPRTALTCAGTVPPLAESAQMGALQPQRLEHEASVDRPVNEIVETRKSGPGSRAQACTNWRGEGAHSMNQPASPGEPTGVCSGDARSSLLPEAAILAPIASRAATSRRHSPLSDTSVGRQSDESLESYGDDQQQDAARPGSDQGHGTSVKLNDGNGSVPSVENHSKANHASARGIRSASSTAHDILQRFPRTKEWSADPKPESEGSRNVGAGVEDAELDAFSSDDEHYNPSVSSHMLLRGQMSEKSSIHLPSIKVRVSCGCCSKIHKLCFADISRKCFINTLRSPVSRRIF